MRASRRRVEAGEFQRQFSMKRQVRFLSKRCNQTDSTDIFINQGRSGLDSSRPLPWEFQTFVREIQRPSQTKTLKYYSRLAKSTWNSFLEYRGARRATARDVRPESESRWASLWALWFVFHFQ
ncbi:Hypothetical_protein [Hexamita inflata]|uniref:Hypothetical_protein n=1 Tax=Hexamita inflata TaxID=28002 RepID=A0AA86NBN8_9EUKA|nr:Hypothetical protein HINF_LOCUS4120 [Hexamita inflata]